MAHVQANGRTAVPPWLGLRLQHWLVERFIATIAAMRVDPHRRSEARSIAYHRTIADRLRTEPGLLASARARVAGWLRADPAPHYAREWQHVLDNHIDSIAAFLIDPGEKARELRQSSPFAGALSPRERWRIWRATRGTERVST